MSYSSIKIGMSKDADVEIKTPIKQKAEISPEIIQRGKDLSLCFWMGLLLPVYGLVISAIILKGDGVRKALEGVLVSFLIYAVLALMIFITAQ